MSDITTTVQSLLQQLTRIADALEEQNALNRQWIEINTQWFTANFEQQKNWMEWNKQNRREDLSRIAQILVVTERGEDVERKE